MSDQHTIGEVGELTTLARILPRLPAGDATVGPGDDAAVVPAPDGRFVVTTDTMLEGADFRLNWSTWHDLGWKAVATNLIDVAAMGAAPTSMVVALAVPPTTLVADLESFATGLADAVAAMAPGCGVVGGDLGTAPNAVIAVTAFGDLRGASPVLRSGARPGDDLFVVGRLGHAATGLTKLFAYEKEHGEWGREAAHPLVSDPFVRAQLAPVTPVSAGVTLARLGVTSMLDVSDGLSLDAMRIARASSVAVELDSDGVRAAAEGAPLEAALHGGEDHALLCTGPAKAVGGAVDGHAMYRIGRVVAGEPEVRLDSVPLASRGWDPYRHGG